MELPALLTLLVAGLAMGLLAGVVGIGGGVLIVPFLYFFYANPEFSGAVVAPGAQATVAHATSLLVIVPTAARGVLAYHRAGLVAWRAVVPIALAAVLGAIGGANLARLMPQHALKLAFGILVIVSGIQLMLRRDRQVETRPLRLGLPIVLAGGVTVGFLSALLGVGGGIVAIPVLIYMVRLDMRRVAATSIAIVGFAATAGAITYMLAGVGESGRPPGSLGFVHLPAALAILPGALLAVQWGARLNQRMSTRALRYVFGVLFLLLGGQLIVENAAAAFAGDE